MNPYASTGITTYLYDLSKLDNTNRKLRQCWGCKEWFVTTDRIMHEHTSKCKKCNYGIIGLPHVGSFASTINTVPTSNVLQSEATLEAFIIKTIEKHSRVLCSE